MLAVRNLQKRFGGNLAVDGISFDLAEGELLAMIGPNGAGKSTTFNMINGQLSPTKGSIALDGVELVGLSSRRIAHMRVGRTFQIAAAFSSMSVIENVQLALMSHARQVFSFWRPAAALHRAAAFDLLGQVGMQEQAGRGCSELAYGDIKRLELAMALAGEPRLLLMDEPTAGMAPEERNALIALVKRLVVQRNMAVLFTEHSMDVVFQYADRIVVLARGQLIAEGTAAQVRAHPKVQEVYFGSGRTLGAASQVET